jgi:hypothetical protein
MTDTNDDAEDKSFSIPEFCSAEDISHASYFKMRRAGLGPTEIRIPGGRIIRITATARREWHRRMEQLAQGEAAQQEQRRRIDQTTRAGQAAAKSEKHISHRRAAAAALRRRG